MLSRHRALDLRLSINESLHMVHRADWNTVARGASPYLQYDHLLALEDRMRASMDFRYVIYYNASNRPVGVACFQAVDVVDRSSAYGDKLCRMGKRVGNHMFEDRSIRCLVSGNVFHTGDHGSHFIGGITEEQRIATVSDTISRLVKAATFRGKPSAMVVKDIERGLSAALNGNLPSSYHLLRTDANMLMDLDPAWKTMAEYEQALNAKARTRLKSVMKKSASLRVSSVEVEAIEASTRRMQELYDAVIARSPFVMGQLNMAVYADWKRQNKEALRVLSYELDGQLVGFSTAFINGDTLDAHYVGLDHALNERHAIYQRMLIDHLECAIRWRSKRINFGRTAEQAKSNLGALPHDMHFLVRHRNPVANKLIGPMLRSVKPAEFELREPFKRNNA